MDNYILPENFKESLSFSSKIESLDEKKFKSLSLASIQKLKKFLPNDVDINDNVGFLPFCGNGFVANRVNENNDIVGHEEAIAIAESSKYIFINTEHCRSHIVGVITSTGYSEFKTNKPLTKEEVLASYKDKPFNVVYSGIIWRVINPKLADYIEESGNPESSIFGNVSLSWEIAFNESKLALLSNDNKNLSEAEIINDEKEASRLNNQSKAGYVDGKRLIRVITGDVLALGFGLVEDPAAEVKGILTKPKESNISVAKVNDEDNNLNISFNIINDKEKADIILDIFIEEDKASEDTMCPECKGEDSEDEDEEEGEDEEDDEEMEDSEAKQEMTCAKCGKKFTNTASKDEVSCATVSKTIKDKIISQLNNVIVNETDININTMKLNSIRDLTDENLKEVKAAIDLVSVFEKEIQKINDDYVKQLNQEKETSKTAQATIESLETKLKEVDSKLANSAEQLNNLIKAQAAREQEELFSARMTAFDEKYNLTDEDREIVGDMIKELDAEKYQSVAKKLETLLSPKIKTAPVQEAVASKEVKEEVNKTEVISDAIDNGNKKEEVIAATSTITPSLQERMNKAFSIENFTTKVSRRK